MRRVLAVAAVCLLLLSGVLAVFAPSATSRVEAADRAIVVSTQYPSITTGKGKELTFPVVITNKGTGDEWLKIELLSAPSNWKALIKDRGLDIREVFVAGGRTDSTAGFVPGQAAVTVSMTPPDTTTAGEYKVSVKATSLDGQVSSTLDLKIGISGDIISGLKMSTQLPAINGSPGSDFSFKLDLVNDASVDRTVDLAAVVPEGWQATFKPAYESNQVSSLRVKAGSTQGADVTISSLSTAATGSYPVTVAASSGSDKASVELKINLVGTGRLSFTSLTGRYNAEANAGGQAIFDILVQNIGAGDLQNLSFSGSPPEGWEVTFEPTKLASLKPGIQQQVQVIINPSGKAIAGDYVLTLRTSSGFTSESMDVRVMVTTSTMWGIVAVLIVAIVLVGMGLVYWQLGRR